MLSGFKCNCEDCRIDGSKVQYKVDLEDEEDWMAWSKLMEIGAFDRQGT